MGNKGCYVDSKTFHDFKTNFDTLIDIFNHNMTVLQTDVKWIKRIVFFVAGLMASIFVAVILNLLIPNGFLMFETVSPDTYEPRLFKPKLEILSSAFTILDDFMVKSEYPLNVPERRFLILQKKSN